MFVVFFSLWYDTLTSTYQDISEILIKLALNTNQSINLISNDILHGVLLEDIFSTN